jgi:RHS repeat-associated protein
VNPFTLTYDAENRITSASGAPGSTTYEYDGDGRRVKKVSGSTTTVFVYDAFGQLAAEYSTAGASSSGTQYLTADHLGSTRLMTDAAGAVKARYDYLPFGEGIGPGLNGRSSKYSVGAFPGVADGQAIKFTGKERDAETGLDYFLARYYSGPQGRFTSPDRPFVDQDESNPQSWNLYSYTRNNPLRFVDPDGQRVRVCITGGQCFEVDDKDYPGLQPGNPGVVLPTFNFGRDEISIQNITCGGQNCGTATYVNDNPGLQPIWFPIAEIRAQVAPLDPRNWARIGVNSTVKSAYDATGKVHGDLPKRVPDSWTREEMQEAAGELRKSIRRRKAEQVQLGEDGPHRARIAEEEQLLRQVEKKLSGS